MLMIGALSFSACNYWDNPAPNDNPSTPTTPTVPGIPSDDLAEANPALPGAPTIVMPAISYSGATRESGLRVLRFDMTGILDPNNMTDWVRLYGTGLSAQNVWIEIDGKAKGVAVKNTIDDQTGATAPVDLVFLIDNSGSMSEEANAVARDILAWAQTLSTTLDIKFGCVGYDGAITGALNITSVDKFKEYLDYSSGTSRTRHFGGTDAAALQSVVNNYRTGGNSAYECGVAALRFADENFAFRTNSNRVYVNFTDEPNQPNGNANFSTEWVRVPENWAQVNKGAIHTVYSSYSFSSDNVNYSERPWNLSDYTGGSKFFTSSSFTGVTLSDIPLTAALQNSYNFRVTNVENLFDGQPHTVHLTILSPNGTIRAERTWTVTF